MNVVSILALLVVVVSASKRPADRINGGPSSNDRFKLAKNTHDNVPHGVRMDVDRSSIPLPPVLRPAPAVRAHVGPLTQVAKWAILRDLMAMSTVGGGVWKKIRGEDNAAKKLRATLQRFGASKDNPFHLNPEELKKPNGDSLVYYVMYLILHYNLDSYFKISPTVLGLFIFSNYAFSSEFPRLFAMMDRPLNPTMRLPQYVYKEYLKEGSSIWIIDCYMKYPEMGNYICLKEDAKSSVEYRWSFYNFSDKSQVDRNVIAKFEAWLANCSS